MFHSVAHTPIAERPDSEKPPTCGDFSDGPAWIRTRDQRIMSCPRAPARPRQFVFGHLAVPKRQAQADHWVRAPRSGHRSLEARRLGKRSGTHRPVSLTVASSPGFSDRGSPRRPPGIRRVSPCGASQAGVGSEQVHTAVPNWQAGHTILEPRTIRLVEVSSGRPGEQSDVVRRSYGDTVE